MPASILQYLVDFSSPLMRGTLPYLAREPFVPVCSASDESIHSFVSRRFGDHIADNLASALVNGIYAGDSHTLSGTITFL